MAPTAAAHKLDGLGLGSRAPWPFGGIATLIARGFLPPLFQSVLIKGKRAADGWLRFALREENAVRMKAWVRCGDTAAIQEKEGANAWLRWSSRRSNVDGPHRRERLPAFRLLREGAR